MIFDGFARMGCARVRFSRFVNSCANTTPQSGVCIPFCSLCSASWCCPSRHIQPLDFELRWLAVLQLEAKQNLAPLKFKWRRVVLLMLSWDVIMDNAERQWSCFAPGHHPHHDVTASATYSLPSSFLNAYRKPGNWTSRRGRWRGSPYICSSNWTQYSACFGWNCDKETRIPGWDLPPLCRFSILMELNPKPCPLVDFPL